MKRLKVTSNAIRSIGYSHDQRHLEVEFHNGRRYVYEDVPHTMFSRMLNADSHGDFLHQELRGVFKHRELPADTESKAADEEPGYE